MCVYVRSFAHSARSSLSLSRWWFCDLIQSAFYRNAPCLNGFLFLCVCVRACLVGVHAAFMNGSDSTIIEPEYDINTVNEYLILRFVVWPVLILIIILSLTHSLAFSSSCFCSCSFFIVRTLYFPFASARRDRHTTARIATYSRNITCVYTCERWMYNKRSNINDADADAARCTILVT